MEIKKNKDLMINIKQFNNCVKFLSSMSSSFCIIPFSKFLLQFIYVKPAELEILQFCYFNTLSKKFFLNDSKTGSTDGDTK